MRSRKNDRRAARLQGWLTYAPASVRSNPMLLKTPEQWKEYGRMVTAAYARAPMFDKREAWRWALLAKHIERMYKQMLSDIRVEFVAGQPYETAEEMSRKVKKSGVMYISTDFNAHPIFTPLQNLQFRAVHDYIVHIAKDKSFTLKGEIGSYNAHAKLVPPDALPALYTEVVGQASTYFTTGEFPKQKIAVLPFDPIRIGIELLRAEQPARAAANGRARPNAGLSKREKALIEAGILPPRDEGYVKPGTFGPFVPMVGKYKYKKKVGGSSLGESVDVALYEGTKRVGLIQLSSVGKRKNLHERCAPLVEALRPLANEFGELRAWFVWYSEVDETRRSEGLGRLLYDAAIDAMYQTPCGHRNPPGPFLFLPGDCVSPYTTSALAGRVWPSLAQNYPHQKVVRGKHVGAFEGQPWENYVLRIDHPPVFRMPKAARKAESAAANPQHARRMRCNPSDLERALAGDKDLSFAALRGADLREADLSHANLSGADLRGADLSGADLRGADLSEADLREADLTNAVLRGADLYGANLREADLSEANLSGADLREAYLSGAYLLGADLSGANLREADLTNANLTGANLTDVDLSEAVNVDEAIGIVEIPRAVLPVQGRSSAFDKWFGKSKIVNEDGTPKVLYHGTNQAGFTAFSKDKIDAWHPGFFLADKPELAQTYSGSPQLDPFATGRNKGIYRVYVRMAKPYIHDAKGSDWKSIPWGKDGIDFINTDGIGAWAKAKKYDGVVIRNVVDIGEYGGFTKPANVYIVFDPTNIKSAAYNRGTWDRKDPDIRRNPNGAPRTPRAPRRARRNRGTAQTQTATFKRWFGDSKVVDENGQPKVVYHGTQSEPFYTFQRPEKRRGVDLYGPGFYFTTHQKTLDTFGNRIMPVYLRIENPVKGMSMTPTQIRKFWDAIRVVKFPNGYDATEDHAHIRERMLADPANAFSHIVNNVSVYFNAEDARQAILAAGIDGVIIPANALGMDEYVVFDPHQIKSATENVGTFDSDNADIRYNPSSARRNESAYPWDASTKVQSLQFDKGVFTADEAKAWAKTHDFKYGKVDVGKGNWLRLRQADPEHFRPSTFRVIPFRDGVQAVIAVPKRSHR